MKTTRATKPSLDEDLQDKLTPDQRFSSKDYLPTYIGKLSAIAASAIIAIIFIIVFIKKKGQVCVTFFEERRSSRHTSSRSWPDDIQKY